MNRPVLGDLARQIRPSVCPAPASKAGNQSRGTVTHRTRGLYRGLRRPRGKGASQDGPPSQPTKCGKRTHAG